MALLFMDSFDHYAPADLAEKWTSTAVTSGAAITIAGSGRRGSTGLRFTTGVASTAITGYAAKVLAPAPADPTVVVGMGINVSAAVVAATSGTGLISIRDGSGAQLTVRVMPDLTLAVHRGAMTTGVYLGGTSVPLTLGSYGYVEVKALIANSGGTVEIRFNGVQVLNLTAQDTHNFSAGWTSLALGQVESAASSNNPPGRTIDFDDLYVLDGTGPAPWNTFLGDCRVDVRMPTGAGASTGWTPSAGANWACVDEAGPNDDTDYTAAAATGINDTFPVQPAPVAGGILGVQVCLSGKKTDAGTCTLAPVVRHSGTNQVGPAQAPGTAYGYLLTPYATNPGTGVAWTEAGFNAAEFGYRRVT